MSGKGGEVFEYYVILVCDLRSLNVFGRYIIFWFFLYGYDLYVEIYKMYIVFGIYV